MPGDVYVGGDSHTNTTGALGAFACGLGHTDIAYVLLNGQIWFKVPETDYFKPNGKLPDHVMAKDLILKIIGILELMEEITEPCSLVVQIDEMSVESRLTLCNMTKVLGAKTELF